MKLKSTVTNVLSLILVAGTLVTCPASYAQTQKPGRRAARQSMTPYTTDQSDPTPGVRIRLQIPGVVAQDIDVFAYDQLTYYPAAPTDGSGGGEGKLIVGPVTVGKRIDEFSPLLNKIHVTGGHITEVTLQWFRVDPSGRSDELFSTIKLSDVTISAIHRSLPNQQDPAFVRLGELEAVSFTYKNIQVTAASDDVAP